MMVVIMRILAICMIGWYEAWRATQGELREVEGWGLRPALKETDASTGFNIHNFEPQHRYVVKLCEAE